MARRAIGCAMALLALAVPDAPATGLPTNVCDDDACGEPQAAVWARFREASGLAPGTAPGVYSGACWHIADSLARDRVHHGGILLDRRDGRTVFDGRFAFFRERNPYRDLSVERARSVFASALPLEIHATYAVAESLTGFAPYRYWLREGPDDGRLLLVGYFGFTHTVLCDLERNPM